MLTNLLGFAGLLAEVGTGGTFSLEFAPVPAPPPPGFLLQLALDGWGGLSREEEEGGADGWFSWFFGRVFTCGG